MIERDGERLKVSGRLTMETVAALYNAGLQPDGDGRLVVDLAGVESVDSAAVSLLLSWQRRAQRDNMKLVYANLPANLLSLARLYGVADLLPVETGAAAPV